MPRVWDEVISGAWGKRKSSCQAFSMLRDRRRRMQGWREGAWCRLDSQFCGSLNGPQFPFLKNNINNIHSFGL